MDEPYFGYFKSKYIEERALEQCRETYNEHAARKKWAEKLMIPGDDYGYQESYEQGYHYCGICYAIWIARELGYQPIYKDTTEEYIVDWIKIKSEKEAL